MPLNTAKALGTLEVLFGNPFLWQIDTLGDFTPLGLLQQERFVEPTDLDVAIDSWRALERRGMVMEDSPEFSCAPSREARNDPWDPVIDEKRGLAYRSLLDLLQHNLQALQALRLGVPPYFQSEYNYYRYSFCLMVGRTVDDRWLCIAPTVPDEFTYDRQYIEPENRLDPSLNSALETSLHRILDQLNPITIYGYYGGGYDYTYPHRLWISTGLTILEAIESSLQNVGMMRIFRDDLQTISEMKQVATFMDANLIGHIIYRFSLWNVRYTYELGQTSNKDWIGIRSMTEFEFNP